MSLEIPGDMVSFVDRMVAQKRFLSENDVLAEGLRLLQSREEVQMGFEQLDGGFGVPADEVYARAEARIREVEKENGTAN